MILRRFYVTENTNGQFPDEPLIISELDCLISQSSSTETQSEQSSEDRDWTWVIYHNEKFVCTVKNMQLVSVYAVRHNHVGIE